MKRAATALSVVLLAWPGPSSAAVSPKAGQGDGRIQSVVYDPEQVIELSVAFGFQLTLELAPDDRIETIAVGNAAFWQVTANKTADRIFIKPSQGAVDTDLSVVSAARTYIFGLHATPFEAKSSPYLVRVLRPAPMVAVAPEGGAARPAATYGFRGDRTLKPSAAFDDGVSTTLVWSGGRPLPAVYALDPGGQESLVNGAVRDGGFVIGGVSETYIVRRGDREGRLSRRVARPPGP